MSVLIPGMEMPKSCCECFAFKSNADGYLFCKAKRIAFGKEDAEWLHLKTPNWCPLVHVPEHGRLIDTSAKVQTQQTRLNLTEIRLNRLQKPPKHGTGGLTMAEYIEREAAKKAIYSGYTVLGLKKEGAFTIGDAFEIIIDNIPAADVAPVRRGRWLETVQPCGWRDEICAECSECGEDFVLDEWCMEDMKNLMHYCPNCGAKMDGEVEK